MKTKLLTFTIFLVLGTIARANDSLSVPLSAKSAGALLGQASISRHIEPYQQEMLQKILLGQSYENRLSIISSACSVQAKFRLRTCTFEIGSDNLNDDDSGWGTVYRLWIQTEDDSDHMIAVKMEMIAG